ncbi:nucleotidyltransferase domain-containing protein [Abyssisolibacter fermentans]|uniref:nucleotidyltransferase domain-containing protein n=1 Tax=Abyssisolibacter fermentans TaxID=1766203 RepID=UPI00082CFC93|nr:nucleotidyltransferase domain-containing protein [Abyssisolibacter fermentans]
MIPKLHEAFIDKSIEILKNDTRILGVTIGGSYINKSMDEYSDIDLVIAIKPDSTQQVMSERFEIAEKLGNLLSAFTGEHVGEPRLIICLYGPPLLHVDLKFVSLDDVNIRVEDPIILWEREHAISNQFKLNDAKFPLPGLQWIEDRFWVWVHYGATKIGRKEIFETIEFISFLRQTVIGPLLLMKNSKLPRGVRRIEYDAPEDLDMLIRTVPSYDVQSCVNALFIIIDLYRDLREYHATDDLIIHSQAEKYSIEYLNNVEYD